ncbi:TIR domain-containing protein [Avibacterium endocarditidis]|uniref:TIR domain-containing protein n=1 Tax=Avibacterium TaxID=292486 RepID=UPI0039FB89B1
MNSIPKHKVFLSFHHIDEQEVRTFEELFSETFGTFISRTVQDGNIDPNSKTDTIRQKIRDHFISDSTVTIVLIGAETWKRKHVDWEIGYSLTNTSQNTRSRLIGILLPSYKPDYNCSIPLETTNDGRDYYTPCNIPPRLHDNVNSGYAKIYSYPSNSHELKQWIHNAFSEREESIHNNCRSYFFQNYNQNKSHWVD